jgi:hypothetical protein
MRGLLLVSGAFLLSVAAPAWAGRSVTDDERAQLLPAVAAGGCSGDKLEFDNGQYEVDDASATTGTCTTWSSTQGFG